MIEQPSHACRIIADTGSSNAQVARACHKAAFIRKPFRGWRWLALAATLAIGLAPSLLRAAGMETYERMAEWTIRCTKTYADPFNDVDVDVVFERDGRTWRVPTFWRGGSEWTVRFAPPEPGTYAYHLESTDRTNLDLNGHEGAVTITSYTGTNPLLRHGMLRVSVNHRTFEHADGTPFYWLGDTWWSGLSTRLSWDDFKKLTADRVKKGFTVVQIVAGLVPFEEQAPSDPGYCNEGGSVWTTGFGQINPRYFDYADRRIQYLVNAGIVPAIVGAWHEKMNEMGVAKLKKHWRYIVARYGAYPVLWIAGGEVYDPVDKTKRQWGDDVDGGWTEVTRYLRSIDPLHQPVTVHSGPLDDPLLQDESLLDFEMPQPGHAGWPSIAAEISYLDTHYARIEVTKPLVIGEIGYERLFEMHLENFQRAAFWMAMLNGAAGYTYGANGTWESYTPDKPFQRWKWSLLTWREGMNLPGSYQIGLGAKLLQEYQWWRFAPHPEWVAPHGTTQLEPRSGPLNHFHVDISGVLDESEWQKLHGRFDLPYAAGIPGEVRFIYQPFRNMKNWSPPTVLGLEPGVRYRAYFWDPSLGIKIDMGDVARAHVGDVIAKASFSPKDPSKWTTLGPIGNRTEGRLTVKGDSISLLDTVPEMNARAAVTFSAESNASLVLRFHDQNNYVAAAYSPKDKAIYILDRRKGIDGQRLGSVAVGDLGQEPTLSAEVKAGWAAVSVSDGSHVYTSQIVRIENTTAGKFGLQHWDDNVLQSFGDFTLRRSPPLARNEHLLRKLYDARGNYRGKMRGEGSAVMKDSHITSWDDFGREQISLLDGWRAGSLPYGRDWVLVLERSH